MYGRLSIDAHSRCVRFFSRGLSPSAGYTRDQWRYMAAIEQLGCRDWPLVQLDRGVSNAFYVLADTHYHGDRNVSKVVAVPRDWFAEITDLDSPLAPLSRDHQQFEIFAQQGIGTVRVLTAWTDGFCAFRKLTEEEWLACTSAA